MNIKSLLLGSAAAATAFTGAQAADAIVIAEPEPMEYVRICDAYGAGYFYIPGTETCLRVSGWMRYQPEGAKRESDVRWYDAAGAVIGAPLALLDNSRGNLNLGSRAFEAPALVNTAAAGLPPANVAWGALTPAQRATYLRSAAGSLTSDRGINKTAGAQVNFDARSETEYGTLRGWVQLEGTAANATAATDINILINRVVIQLGGLWMGYADSLFSSSSNIGGSGLGNYGGFTIADTFGYHYEQRNQVGYQFSGSNGFWGAVSLEHDGNANYTPDVVGKVAWSQGWGGVWLAAAYDESAEGMGVRGGVQGNLGALTARLDAYYTSNAAVTYGRDARWAVQGTALYQINPKFGIAAGLEYRKDLATNAALADAILAVGGLDATGRTGMYFSDSHAWAAQVGINWTPVQNFQIGADVTYNKERYNLASGLATPATPGAARIDQDHTRFRLRFQRNF